jgi:tetratricopeptide (TPR) repeat protein
MKPVRSIILYATCIIMSIAIAGCAVQQGKRYEKNGKVYGKTDGLFKEKWNDFYLRGLSYGDGGFWEDAAADFREARQQRDKDQRRARTYGLHFVDYFPNRELGIACYNLGRFQEAITALETSLAAVETARAKFYLNKARQAWLNKAGLDATAPTIAVSFPPADYITNRFAISISGTARDNFFVAGLSFNNRPQPLELSLPEVAFNQELQLHAGENIITLRAEDLVGSVSPQVTLRVHVDREGPLVFLDAAQDAQGGSLVTGEIYDASGVAKLTLHTHTLAAATGRILRIHERFTASEISGRTPLAFEAVDHAGNATRGALSIVPSSTAMPYGLPCLASAAAGLPAMTLPVAPAAANLLAYAAPGADQGRMQITIKGLHDGQIVFHDALFLEGTVVAPRGIQEVTVNGAALLNASADQSLSSFLKGLAQGKRGSLAFSKLIQLDEGQNSIVIQVRDAGGATTQKKIEVLRKIPKVRQIGSRLSVAICPFKEQNKTLEPLTEHVQTFLSYAFVDQKRFHVLERRELQRLLEEQKISQEAIFDTQTAVRLGRLLAAETMIFGDIFATEKSIEVVARMVDTETSLILAEKDIYVEGELQGGLKESLQGLALKFKSHFPVCEGSIIAKKTDAIIVNLGTDSALSNGMRLLAFTESEPVIDPATGSSLGTDTDILAQLMTSEVHEKFSKTDVMKQFTSGPLEVGCKVIAK